MRSGSTSATPAIPRERSGFDAERLGDLLDHSRLGGREPAIGPGGVEQHLDELAALLERQRADDRLGLVPALQIGDGVALAYDGKIWLLRDTNNDGLEDKADLFWDNSSGLRSPIGMDLTPPGYERGSGVFVIGTTRAS